MIIGAIRLRKSEEKQPFDHHLTIENWSQAPLQKPSPPEIGQR